MLKLIFPISAFLVTFSTNSFSIDLERISPESYIDVNHTLIDSALMYYNGKSYLFVEYAVDGSKVSRYFYLDSNGVKHKAKESDWPPKTNSPQTKEILSKFNDSEEVEIVIALSMPRYDGEVSTATSFSVYEWDTNELLVSDDGGPAKTEDLSAFLKKEEAERKASNLIRQEKSNSGIEKLAELLPTKKEALLSQKNSSLGTVYLRVSEEEFKVLLDKGGKYIIGMELRRKATEGMFSAMHETNVDPWALDYTDRRGGGIGIFMSEEGCPASSYMTNYSRLGGFSSTDHSKQVIGVLKAAAPSSYVYCSGESLKTPRSYDYDGTDGGPPIHLVSLSVGVAGSSPGHSRFYTLLDRDWDNVVMHHDVPVFVLSGNYLPQNHTSWKPSGAANVIPIGSYNEVTGASSTFTSYNTYSRNKSPILMAPGEDIDTAGFNVDGTSFATPHVAAIAADLMSDGAWLRFRPEAIAARLIASSDEKVTGYMPQRLVGKVDFADAIYGGVTYNWKGGPHADAFDALAATDGVGSLSSLSVMRNFNASEDSVSVGIVTLTDGDAVYAEYLRSYDPFWKPDIVPSKYTVMIYDPNGNYVSQAHMGLGSRGFTKFDPEISGSYEFRITRSGVLSFSSAYEEIPLRLGMNISW